VLDVAPAPGWSIGEQHITADQVEVQFVGSPGSSIVWAQLEEHQLVGGVIAADR
jgi:hypothetical protein